MADKVGDFLLRRLHQWGVRRIYGYPGDGINGILGALSRQGAIEFIQTRHEELAAFMACAHAKFSGEVGVCMATSGPGAIHLLNGLYDARLDHQPVLAIVGQQKRVSLGLITSRKSTSSACSRTWRMNMCRWPAARSKPGTWWTAQCALPAISAA
jgi:pyruvate dehydrogenase (quinone)